MTDLKAMVGDLIELGMTQAEIGRAIGRSQSTVSDLRNEGGKRPTHATVEALRKLHAQRMKQKAA